MSFTAAYRQAILDDLATISGLKVTGEMEDIMKRSPPHCELAGSGIGESESDSENLTAATAFEKHIVVGGRLTVQEIRSGIDPVVTMADLLDSVLNVFEREDGLLRNLVSGSNRLLYVIADFSAPSRISGLSDGWMVCDFELRFQTTYTRGTL